MVIPGFLSGDSLRSRSNAMSEREREREMYFKALPPMTVGLVSLTPTGRLEMQERAASAVHSESHRL